MEYAKDMVLDIRYKREVGVNKLKDWTSNLKKILKNNKIIIVTLSMLIVLTVVDIVLVNSFMQLLAKLY